MRYAYVTYKNFLLKEEVFVLLGERFDDIIIL